jgi:hypothetical protein
MRNHQERVFRPTVSSSDSQLETRELLSGLVISHSFHVAHAAVVHATAPIHRAALTAITLPASMTLATPAPSGGTNPITGSPYSYFNPFLHKIVTGSDGKPSLVVMFNGGRTPSQLH